MRSIAPAATASKFNGGSSGWRAIGLLLLMMCWHALAHADVNVALRTNGAFALASSVYSNGGNYGPNGAINGDHLVWGSNGDGWNDNTYFGYDDWLEVRFNGAQTITEIDLYHVQDNVGSPVEPGPTDTFSLYGITAFEMQSWDGSAWVTVPGGNISGNNLVRNRVTFAPITTTKIRLLVHATSDGYTRVVELEAWAASQSPPPPGPPPLVNVALNKPAMSSSDYDFPNFVAGNAVDGNTGSFNHTLNNPQSWLQVDLQRVYGVETVRVVNRQDCCTGRLRNLHVLVSDTPFTSTDLNTTIAQAGVSDFYYSGSPGTSPVEFYVGRSARYVRVQLSEQDYLHLAELEVYAVAPLYNASFEYPYLGNNGYAYAHTTDPSGAGWTFNNAGVTANGTDILDNNPTAPAGVQAGRAGPAKLNSPMRVDTAPEGEDIACENWSKHEQKTPPHALSGIQGQGGAGRHLWRQDVGRAGAAA